MIIPPFKDKGENGAEFYCLAFTQVKYRQRRAPRFPAVLGIYFSASENFARFSRISFAADGHRLSYSRGHENHDTLEFVMLRELLESSIHPACWRSFPRAQMPAKFRSAPYEEARHALCLLLFHFRGLESAARLIAGLPNEPLMLCDEAVRRIALGDFKDEDEEIKNAILQQVRESGQG